MLKPELWNYELPWWNFPSNLLSVMVEKNVVWGNDIAVLFNIKEVVQGWRKENDGSIHKYLADYTHGQIVSKEKYHFGTYELICRLPSFRGSFPAFWLIDVDNLPPEIDIMEAPVKSCIDRFKTSATFHEKPIGNEYSHIVKSKAIWQIKDISASDMKFTLVWKPDKLEWYVDGGLVMVLIKSETKNFPLSPMNIIVNAGVADWNVQNDKLQPVIIKQLNYKPL